MKFSKISQNLESLKVPCMIKFNISPVKYYLRILLWEKIKCSNLATVSLVILFKVWPIMKIFILINLLKTVIILTLSMDTFIPQFLDVNISIKLKLLSHILKRMNFPNITLYIVKQISTQMISMMMMIMKIYNRLINLIKKINNLKLIMYIRNLWNFSMIDYFYNLLLTPQKNYKNSYRKWNNYYEREIYNLICRN